MKEKSYVFLFLGRLLIGLVFAYSGYTKLMDPVENFQGAVAAYDIIPYIFVPYIARIIPWIEFIFGMLVLAGYMTRVSALVIAGMSLSFVVLIAATKVLTGTMPADCGCFGEGSFFHLAPLQVVVLDIVSAVIGLKLFLTSKHPFSLDALLNPPERLPK